MSMNFIPCVAWVKRGVAKAIPEKVKLSADELKELIEATKEDLGELNLDDDIGTDSEISEQDEPIDGATASPEETDKKAKKRKRKKKEPDVADVCDDDDDDDDKDVIDEYDMDNYDAEDEGDSFGGIAGLTYYANNEEDPYITMKEEIDSDEEEFEIRPVDNLLLCGRVKSDHSNLDVFVYNEDANDFFIHHDFLLPAFPLAMEWLDFDPGDEKPCNMVAVSSMEPTIGIWDLDLEDSVEPVITLGEKQRKKKAKKKRCGVGGHTDAVLDLSWNRNVRNVLASCSADTTVCLWDLTEGKVVKSLQHQDKVQTIEWHPFEAQTLLSGSFDKTIRLFDCRSSDNDCKKWNIAGEVERVTWNKFSPFHFLVSSDAGFVYLFDVRTDKSVFTLSAHTEPVTGLCLSSQVPYLLVTGSADKTVKVWDILDNKPQMVVEKNFKQGGVQCISCCPDAPYVFAAGSEKDVTVWDTRDSKLVKEHFEGRTAGATPEQTSATETKDSQSSESITQKPTKSDSQTQSASNLKKKKKNKKKKPKSG